jgi:YidC/Oxa1 family membrane protein insertase
MQKRFALFFILSAAIFIGWQFIMQVYFPPPPPAEAPQPQTQNTGTPAPEASASATPAPAESTPPAPPAVQAELRQIKLQTPLWRGTLSNQGGVLTEFTVTHFIDGMAIDKEKGGVNLISAKLSQEIGAPLRFFIPSDRELEKELNAAHYVVENFPEPEAKLEKGEQKEITFVYSNNGVTARKKLRFNGSGYDFNLQVEVARNGQPVETSIVVGPNFGDHGITKYGYYKPAPMVTYAAAGSVEREDGSSVKGTEPHPIQTPSISWAAVDDNYFAMALVPANPASAIHLTNVRRREKIGESEEERNYVSVAVPVTHGQVHHIYAGPKDPDTLTEVSQKFGLKPNQANLEDVINYGFLSFIVKPLAWLMLQGLLICNKVIGNYGWSIVALTVVLNMFFFPLRWKSSVSMKRTAAMQPKMKELQERMKKLDKKDPRMAELQQEQIALMREGNPLMGCLPLLLQMPFFYAVFIILTVSIEVRHAPFFGWIQDLSSPDQYWILPIVMCVSMIVQTALTPSTADPVQKKIGYLMPLLFTGMFFIYAPAGLVLYWMVGNLVGIGQQMVINKMNPPPTPATTTDSKTDKAKPQTSKRKKSKEALANS